MRRFASRPLRRSSSRLRRWVQDQQKRHSGGDIPNRASNSPQSDATAGVPGLQPAFATRRSSAPLPGDDVEDRVSVATESFVIVADAEDAHQVGTLHVTRDPARSLTRVCLQPENAPHVIDLSTSPTSPRKTRPSTLSFNAPSPLRNFAKNLSHGRRLSSTSNVTRDPSPTRSSVRPRQTRTSSHSRASSIATNIFAPRTSREAPSDVTSVSSSPSSNWKFRRGAMMGQLLSASDGANNEDSSRPPRPSTSSSITRSSETAYTRTSLDSTSTSQQRPIIAPARSSSPQSMLFAPTPSLWSLPTDASHINDPPESDKTIARERATSGPLRIPLTFRGSSGSSGASILPTHRRKRKRKLVISGIPPGDSRRYDHIRLWCEVRLRHALYSTPTDPPRSPLVTSTKSHVSRMAICTSTFVRPRWLTRCVV